MRLPGYLDSCRKKNWPAEQSVHRTRQLGATVVAERVHLVLVEAAQPAPQAKGGGRATIEIVNHEVPVMKLS